MDSERNPQLASILSKLKNPSEAVNEQQTTLAFGGHSPPQSNVFTTKSSSQTSEIPATTDPRRRPAASFVDQSKITTWTVAQKYVIDNIYSNQAKASRIKQLINNQQGQETQWWAERNALILKHRGRVEKEKQVAAMLQSLGGITAPMNPSSSGEEEAELRRCDLKIHKAMAKLATEIDRELRSMGVPFYAIKHELVIVEECKDGRFQLGIIEKGELRDLQKRMLQLLEELFKE